MIVLASIVFSLQGLRSDNRNVQDLSSLCLLLELMQGELEAKASPLPELFDYLEPYATAGSAHLVQQMKRKLPDLGNVTFSQIWESCVKESFSTMDKPLLRELLSLGAVLGRYDTTRQCEAIRTCLAAVRARLEEAVKNRPQRYKLLLGLPMTAGTLLILLLI